MASGGQERDGSGENNIRRGVKRFLRATMVISRSVPQEDLSSRDSNDDFEDYLRQREVLDEGLTRYHVPDPVLDHLADQLDRSFTPPVHGTGDLQI